jgi:hypothetical protein
MSRPTHLLRHEHRIIEQAIRALEGMCIRMQTGNRKSRYFSDLRKKCWMTRSKIRSLTLSQMGIK